ncbi:MAG: magnesium transporter [Candidatus Bathyarchaeota archaeon]|nr:MAG: magnesium transporter [Candidatus Bathyarchaeota archaeon]
MPRARYQKRGGQTGWMEVTAMIATNIVETISATRLKANLIQSLLSFSFDFGGLLTGTLLVLYFDVVKEVPWALILFPGILSVRGAVGGFFSGHLSTGLHLGTVRASYTKNTKDFHSLLYATITLALFSGLTVGIGTSVFGVFLWNATLIDFLELLAVIIATVALSVLFVSPLTMAFSVLSFRRGLDPDIIVYPITSTLSDIINTACYIFSLNMFFETGHFGNYLIGILDLVFVSVVVYILVKNVREKKFAMMIKEFLLTLLFVTVIVNFTGSFLDKISTRLHNGTEIFVIYPALITTIGGVGSIIGSTATTKLALGIIKPSFSSIRQHLDEIGGSWIASIIMFTLYSIISSAASGTTALSGLLKFLAQLLTANILSVSAMVIVAYAVAISTYRRGLDPDNFVIPIESSLADSMMTLSLLTALTVIV